MDFLSIYLIAFDRRFAASPILSNVPSCRTGGTVSPSNKRVDWLFLMSPSVTRKFSLRYLDLKGPRTGGVFKAPFSDSRERFLIRQTLLSPDPLPFIICSINVFCIYLLLFSQIEAPSSPAFAPIVLVPAFIEWISQPPRTSLGFSITWQWHWVSLDAQYSTSITSSFLD